MRTDYLPVADIRSVADIAARLAGARRREAAAAERLRLDQIARRAAAAEACVARQRVAAEALAAVRVARAAAIAGVTLPATPEPEPKRILAEVAERFGLTVADLVGPRRHRPIVRARYAAIAAVQAAHPRFSLPRLGRIFQRHHTSILASLRWIAANGVPRPPIRASAGAVGETDA